MLGDDAIVSLASNHPKQGDVPTFNNALCGLWAAGLGTGRDPVAREAVELQAGRDGAATSAAPCARRAPAWPPARAGAEAAPEPAPAAVAGEARRRMSPW